MRTGMRGAGGAGGGTGAESRIRTRGRGVRRARYRGRNGDEGRVGRDAGRRGPRRRRRLGQRGLAEVVRRAGAALALVALTLLTVSPAVAPAATGDTITGTCVLSNGRKAVNPHISDPIPSFCCDITFEDTGITLTGWCREHETLGGIASNDIAAPGAGTYRYTGTRNPDGTYDVIVESQDARNYWPGCWPFENGEPMGAYVGDPAIPRQHIHVYDYNPTVRVDFTKVSADASISAGNAEYAYAGAVYEIRRASDDALVATITTDDRGEAQADLAPNTGYYAIEKTAPQGFAVNPDRIEFSTGTRDADVELPDAPGTVTLIVRKTDSATGGGPRPGASLEGATYRVVDANGATHEAVTGEDGSFTVSGLPLGAVTVTETAPPEGYLADAEVHEYRVGADELAGGDTVELAPAGDFAEDVIAFDIDLVKYRDSGDEGSGLQQGAEGVRFQVISNTTGEVVAELETDADGRATTADGGAWHGSGERPAGAGGSLPYDAGGYTVREVPSSTPEGYRPAPDWQIGPEEMAAGAVLHYIVDNDFVSTRLQIVKVDASSGATVPLAGFTFQVLDAEGNPVTQEAWHPAHVELSEFTTDESGTVTLPEPLAPGSYRVHELAVVAPYLPAADVAFEVPDTAELPPVTVVRVADERARGQATIEKACSAPDGSDDAATCDGGCAGSLEGAAFDVVALEDVVTPDGIVEAVEGQVVDHVVTDETGTATTSELPLGSGRARYAFVETEPPSGHALDTEPHGFELVYEDAGTPVVTASVRVEDAPTQTVIDKTVMGSGAALPGATFEVWSARDEVRLDAADGEAALAIRAEGAGRVEVASVPGYSTIEGDLPDGWTLELVARDGGGSVAVPVGEPAIVDAGTYDVRLSDAGGKAVEVGDASPIEIPEDATCTVAWSEGIAGIGRGFSFSARSLASERIELEADSEQGCFVLAGAPSGELAVYVDGERAGELDVDEGEHAFAVADEDGVHVANHLLVPGGEAWSVTTDDGGSAQIRHLPTGSYRIAEVSAPDGFLPADGVRSFTVDADGLTEGEAVHHIGIEDDFTKVDFSKRDASDEAEVPGARLRVVDAGGNVVEEWTSGEGDHRIDGLAPGDYELQELALPHGYDVAKSVPFTVRQTGEVQRVTMYDEPIEVSARIDKRQEICDPPAEGVEADPEANHTDVRISDDGTYRYQVDFQNTSGTWVDEFTVTDELGAASEGLADLVSVTTPQAGNDYDGLLNVWYRTDAGDGEGGDAANATLGDGHANPWLAHESTAERLDGDGRVVDYTGWRLWAADVDASEATRLDASDLDLAEGERVVAIRFEYGRVEEGFTTRSEGWDREDLKDPHDDVAEVTVTHEGDPVSPDGGRDRAPALIEMRATDAYTEDAVLVNTAAVEAYRDGGNLSEDEHLEDRDADTVEQSPRRDQAGPVPSERARRLDQTGGTALGAGLLAAAGAAVASAFALRGHGPAGGSCGRGRSTGSPCRERWRR